MIRRTSDNKQFIEIEDQEVLVEVDSETPTVYFKNTKDAEWTHQLHTNGEQTSFDESPTASQLFFEDQEITSDKAVQLLEEGKTSKDRPIKAEKSTWLPGKVKAESFATTEPKLYDPKENELSDNGVEIPELDSFVERHRQLDTEQFLGELFETLYEPEGFDLVHSTDYDSSLAAENTDIEEYDEDVRKVLNERGHAFCGELEKLVTYTLRNKDVPASQLPGNHVLRYDEDENGITIPDSRGDNIVEHGFNYFENSEGDYELIDASIYLHLREAGLDHDEAFKFSRNRDDVYWLENQLNAPYNDEDVNEDVYQELELFDAE